MSISDQLKNITNITPLKKGGQKEVYRGLHPIYGEVAIKIGSTDGVAIRKSRIEREVRLLSNIDSVFYPKVFEFHFENDRARSFL